MAIRIVAIQCSVLKVMLFNIVDALLYPKLVNRIITKRRGPVKLPHSGLDVPAFHCAAPAAISKIFAGMHAA